jgi:hypothetical protein
MYVITGAPSLHSIVFVAPLNAQRYPVLEISCRYILVVPNLSSL